MFVLKIANTSPAIYIGVIDGFFEKVETTNQALQLGRMSDAQSMQSIIVDTVEVVSLP